MKIRTAHRIARLGMVTLSAAALTSLGCSLLVNFDDSLIPVPDGGEETGDGGADVTVDAPSDNGADTTTGDADATSGDADATSSDADATSVDGDATSVDGDATSSDADATSVDGDAIVDETDAGGDTSVDETTDATAEASDAGSDSTAEETSTGDAADAETSSDAAIDVAPPAPVFVRAANLINAGSAIDVCVASNTVGSINWTTTTPLLRSASSSSSGLPFETVSGYFSLPADTYQARLVAGGSTNCGTELNVGSSTFTLSAFAGGSYNTITAIGAPSGSGATAEKLVAIVDEVGKATGTNAANARFFHADPQIGAVDVGVIFGGAPDKEWKDVPFGSAVPLPGNPLGIGTLDANGYVELLSLLPDPASLFDTANGSSVQLAQGVFSFTRGDTVSVFAVAHGTADVLFACDDTVPALVSAGTLTNTSCVELAPPAPPPDAGVDTGSDDAGTIDATGGDSAATDSGSADTSGTETASTDAGTDVATDVATDAATSIAHVRVAHFSPGAPSVGICVAPVSASPAWASITPELGGAGVSFEQVTGYLDLPAGAYEIRLVTPGSANCGTELIAGATTFTLPAFAADEYATVAAIGIVGHTDATAFQLATLVDEVGDAPTGSAVAIRFYQGDPALGALDIGLITAPGTPPTIANEWTNVAFASDDANATVTFGNGDSTGTAMTTDPNGYIALPALTAPPFYLAASNHAGGAIAFTGVLPVTGAPTLSIFALNNGTTDVFFVCDDTTPAEIAASQFASNCKELTPVPTESADAGSDAGSESAVDSGASDTGTDVATDAGASDAATAMQNTRFVHLASSFAALDLCVAPTVASIDWTVVKPQGFSLGLTTGLSLSTVTAYQAAPAIATTVRLVEGGASDCNTEASSGSTFSLPALTSGAYASLVAVNQHNDDAANGVTLIPIIDDVGAPAAGAYINARVFNAADTLGTQDIGLFTPPAGDAGASITALWAGLGYATATPTSYPLVAASTPGLAVDGNQYLFIAQALATGFGLTTPLPIGAQTSGSTTVDLSAAVAIATTTVDGGTTTVPSTLSVFLFNNGTKNAFYVCDDTAPVTFTIGTPFSNCTQY